MNLYDAHNHLHDERLQPWIGEILQSLPTTGLKCAVVAGSCEDDWEDVAVLARAHSWIKPSFGLHPWYVRERTPQWKEALLAFLEEFPNAAVGEIGLDRWIADPEIEAQMEVFRWQLNLAATQNRTVTIHCLKAWGLLDEALRTSPLPARGFLLHSFGGPAEMVPTFAKLGAYFSLSPYFCHERKTRQALTFASVPADRLLAETDAPDMWPPDELNEHPLHAPDGKPLNHPANLLLSYRKLAELRGVALEEFAPQIEQNFLRLFGAVEEMADSASAAKKCRHDCERHEDHAGWFRHDARFGTRQPTPQVQPLQRHIPGRCRMVRRWNPKQAK